MHYSLYKKKFDTQMSHELQANPPTSFWYLNLIKYCLFDYLHHYVKRTKFTLNLVQLLSAYLALQEVKT